MIRVVSAGLALIQDRGRSFQEAGVPTSGAWDLERYRELELLLDVVNPAAFELVAGHLSLISDRTWVVATTGPARMYLNGMDLGENQVIEVLAGMQLDVAHSGPGPAYVAPYGLKAELTLGSASSDTLSALGPSPVRGGDSFPLIEMLDGSSLVGRFLIAGSPVPVREIRYVPGPHVRPGTWSARVEACSRSGIRLSAVDEFTSQAGSLPSVPVIPGVIQVPPSGKPIVLGPDCGVTGGYLVAGVVVDADLPKLARLVPGTDIVFTPVAAKSVPMPAASPLVDLKFT